MVPFSQRFFAMLRLRDNLAFATLAVVVAVVVAAFFAKEKFLPGDAFQSIISGGFLLKKNIAILFFLLRKMIGRF